MRIADAQRSPAVLALLVVLVAGLTSCRPSNDDDARMLTGGDPAKGNAAIRKYGCGSCHEIPGVAGARGRVGPPLTAVGDRQYLAGRLQNTPGNMIAWIRTPQSFEPGTVMPNMDVGERDARDIAAYLFTLR